MASRTAPPINSPRTVGYDDFVDQRIQKTRSAVKSADLVTGLVTLLAWVLGLLLLAAAADHWLVAGGFDRWGRFALFAIGLVGGLLYLGTRLGPALIGRVNPLYAAQQIERESPQLKNSLLNLLQLRGNRAGGPAAVHRTLERQAAEGLAAVGETTIDRSGLVRSARIVLALVAAIGIYVVASPKDFFASAGRVLAPWADIAVPSRVQISMLEPGEVELAQGERIEVSALVAGLRESELVELVYSTEDGRLVERRVPMIPRREKSLQYAVSLPAGGGSAAALGLQGDLTYRLEAGDARTRNYEVTVLTAPTIAPVSVTYQYPAYTGFTKQEVEGVGDLRALEGTRVTIAAQANLPIDSAQIDLGADGRPDTRMKIDGERATGSFFLRRDPNTAGDSATSYVLRFTSKDNQANNNPPQYRVEVLADLVPEASILVPAETAINVTLNQRVRLEIEARDPDFALRGVRLVGEAGGKRVLDERLLTKAFQGKFTSELFIVPRDLGLQPGAVLEYWVEAIDNKTPQPNRGESEHKQLRVVGRADNAANDPGQGEQQPGQGQPQPGEGSDEPDAGNQGQPGRNGGQQSKQPSGGSEQNPGEPSNQGGQQEQQGKQNENPEDQENQDGKSRKPSPDGLRAPGGGGGEGNDEEAESSSSSGSEEGGESDSQSNSPPGSGSESGSDGQDPSGNQGSQPGESGESSGNRDQQRNQQGNQNGEEGQQGTDSQSDGDNQDGSGESEAPVPRNGEDDATAFERIREFLKNQQDSGGGGEKGREKDRRRQSGEPNSQSESETDPGQSGNQNQPGRQGDPSERPEGEGKRSESDPSDPREGSPDEQGQKGQGTPQEGSPNSKQQPRDGEAGQQPDRPEEGAGPGEQDRSGQQSDSANSESGGETPPGESTDPQAGPREGTGSSGQNQAADQGAGQSGDQGAGDSTDRPGSQQQSDQPTGESGGEQAGEGSQSSEGGDKPGGNEQSSDTSGKGSGAGGDESGAESRNNQTVDESGQQGSSDAGDTGGQPGDSAGEQGSGQQNSGDAANGESGQSASDGAKPGDSQKGKQPKDNSPGEQGQGKSGEATGPPTGKSSQSGTTDTPGDGTEPGGDAANLDYAREQTELVLEELEEQLTKREVDRKLLEKLGWDEQDLRRFVERWQSRKQRATERGPAGEAELDQALRNLGLSPGNAKATRKISKDQLRDLRERARQAIPPRLRQATDAYNRSLNALGEDSAASGKD